MKKYAANETEIIGETFFKAPKDAEQFRAKTTKAVYRETLLELSQQQKIVTDNWLTHWVNEYYHGKI